MKTVRLHFFRKSVLRLFHFFCLLFVIAANRAGAEAERLFYLSNGEVMEGCIYKPSARGVFPAVVFIQGRGAKPLPTEGPIDPYPKLGKFYNDHNYVLFVPGRHKAKKGVDVTESAGASTSVTEKSDEEKLLRSFQDETEVIFAAIETLKAQSCVNARKVFVSGFGSGGTLSLMLAQKDLDVRGYIVFSPAVEGWDQKTSLQNELKQAVRNAHAPIFLIQPENDTSLGPSDVLGKLLVEKGDLSRSKVFSKRPNSERPGLTFALNLSDVWGREVLSFFEQASK